MDELTMCLGIPMRICEINGFMATCEAKGVFRDVSLFMLQDESVQVDDFVVVHVGYAIQKITPQEAQTAWDLYEQMLMADQVAGPAGHPVQKDQDIRS